MNDNVMDAQPSDFEGSELIMVDKFSTVDQYNVYAIPKKSGGKRIIEAPSDALKDAQRKSIERIQRTFMNMAASSEAFEQYEEDVREILKDSKLSKEDQNEARKGAKEKLSDAMSGNRPVLQIAHFAHAFARERNIASGAKPHVGQEVVLTVDLSDFFPSVKFSHFDPAYADRDESSDLRMNWKSKSYKTPMHYVFGSKKMSRKGAFMQLYIDKILPELKMHFCDFGDGKGMRLPQGAPGSPFLSNVLMCRLDYRAAWRAYPEKVQYTRYADDLIFSGADEMAVKRVYARVVGLLSQLGMRINKRKYTLKKGNQRKKVLGLVVNERLNTTRYFRRRLRAMKHHCRVIHTLEQLGKQRGFKVPKDLRKFFLSKTEGMSFGDKMNKVVKQLQDQGANISMEDLQSKKLFDPPRWMTRKIQGHAAFQHMIENPPENAQDSISYCAVQEMLSLAGPKTG
jgi:hypothetical protein